MDYLSMLSRRSTVTFAEVTELAYASNETEIRQSSATARESVYRIHLEPAFGARPISEITSLEIEIWMLALRQHVSPFTHRLLSRESVRMAYLRLATTLNFAARHGLLDSNPARAVRSPRKTVAAPTYLEPAEVDALAERLDARAPYGLIVRTAALTGLRRGELAALRVRDIAVDSGHIEVRRTVQRRPGGWAYGPPKSPRSTRNVPVASALLAELEQFLSEHPYRNDSEALLWPGTVQLRNGICGIPSYDRQIDLVTLQRNSLAAAARRLHLGVVNWRTLRHSYASLMAAAGVDIFKVSRWMGHANVAVTDEIYTHLFRRSHELDIAKVDTYLAGRR
jgi:integrase